MTNEETINFAITDLGRKAQITARKIELLTEKLNRVEAQSMHRRAVVASDPATSAIDAAIAILDTSTATLLRRDHIHRTEVSTILERVRQALRAK